MEHGGGGVHIGDCEQAKTNATEINELVSC